MEVCKLICIGSGSSGNGYIIKCSKESLIIELGCKWKDYLKALNYEEGVSMVSGCITTHL